VFEPVSERGKKGMDELHEQTVNLLSFQQMPKSVFDVQVAFNLLSHYGERAATTLQAVERRVLHHLQQITGGRAPLPSLMLVQSPIFHGHIFSIYIELGRELPVADVTTALAGEHVTVIPSGEEQPNNVNVAGQENIMLSVRPDHQKGIWIWAAVDNLKLAAITAVDCAAALALTRSQGTVQ
jgi:aspartate-semialdehyde dehydrogenase